MRGLLSVLMVIVGLASPGHAQGVFIPMDEAKSLVTAQARALGDTALDDALIIIGNDGRLSQNTPSQARPLGLPGALYAIALAHRLVDAGVVAWSDTLDQHLPPALQVARGDMADPTLADLISHQGGFAQPTYILDTPLGGQRTQRPEQMSRHVRRLRSPGRLASFDVIGLALLVKALETATVSEFPDLVDEWVIRPLALGPVSLSPPPSIPETRCPPAPRPCPLLPTDLTAPVLGITANPSDLVRLAMAMLGSGDHGGFLTASARQLLTTAQWQINPLAVGWTAGFPQIDLAGRPGLDLTDFGEAMHSQLLLLPGADVVLYGHGYRRAQTASDGWGTTTAALMALVRQFIPPRTARDRAAAGVPAIDGDAVAGRYARLEAATPWLGDRLTRRIQGSMLVEAISNDQLAVDGRLYQRTGPLEFTSADGTVLHVTDSPDGGVAQVEPVHGLLVRTGMLSDPALVLRPVPVAILLIMTAAIYGFVTVPSLWRRMAFMAVGGAVLFFLGLASELAFYHKLWLDQGNGLLVAFWRLGFNVGLMLLLTTPLFAIRFARTGLMPHGTLLPFAAAHLTVLSAAALYLLAVAVIWGFAGEFWP